MRVFMILYYYFKAKLFSKFLCLIDIKKWHKQKIKKHIKKVVKKSNFYQKLYDGYDLDDFDNLPIIDKKIMMDNFDNLNTVNISKKEAFELAILSEKNRDFKSKIKGMTIGLSSGTSGNRGLFLASKNEQLKWAGTILAKTLPRSIFSKHKIAFFLRANSNLYETIGGKNIKFMFFDTLSDINHLIKNLGEFNPTMLVAPSSMLRIIAEEQNKLNIKINPEKIISVAEVLDVIDEKYIEKTFSQKIHQIYQCTEGFIASTCECGKLHINEDLLHIDKEYISNDKFIPIITDFTRISQPIIRYRLNDILVDDKTDLCSCNLPFSTILKIEGRCDDIFYFKKIVSGEYKKVFPDFVTRAVIMASSKVIEYRVVQNNENNIDFYIKTSGDFDSICDLIKNSFEELLNKLDVVKPNLNFYKYETQSREKKLKRVESKYGK